jgi:tetratricopeptide (TPR) repeat protein
MVLKSVLGIFAGVCVLAAVGFFLWPESSDPETRRPQTPTSVHRLLGDAEDVVLVEGIEGLRATASPNLKDIIQLLAQSSHGQDSLGSLKIDYPQDASIIPPEIVPLTFLWHEPVEQVDTWLVDIAAENDSEHIYILAPGKSPPAGQIDPRCVSESNEIYQPTPHQASAKSWTPTWEVWEAIKRCSTGSAASVTILGFDSNQPREPLSQGRIKITTSTDPVGAPIFYRDVPLAPSKTKKGEIKPLDEATVTLIAWRLRDISKAESRLVLTDMPTCANCHSFSTDGKTLGMDLDGPDGDKGAYVIAPVSKTLVLEHEHVITWNSFKEKPKDHKTIGFLSQVSPDGQYVATTVNESIYVTNFMDYRFLQVFYPTRGILAFYSRVTNEMKALPGADDPNYVHCDPVWSPQGDYLVFARAEAKDPYPANGKLATYANDPVETQIRYDLYRIPFEGGRGGKPEAIVGASANGMSNTFPKVSPDGKWIVFVQCRNGQLMRPDGKLWIVPAGGGTARLMRCNTNRMNSWHSFSPSGRWMVFSSKANTPYTQMFLTHIDENGNDSPPILIPNSTASNRAVNLPEFVHVSYDGFVEIDAPLLKYRREFLRGELLADSGKLDESLAHFNKSIELQPDFQKGRVRAAGILIKKGMLEEATVRLQEVLDLNPGHLDAHFRLAGVLETKGLIEEAIPHYEKVLELDSRHLKAHVNLARIFFNKGMLEEATNQFRELLKINTDDPFNHFDLACVLVKRGLIEEAIESFRRAVEIDPRFVDGHLRLGQTLASQGDFESAIAHLRTVISLDPDNLPALNELAWLLATCSTAEIRDGAWAVRLIEPACAATGYRNPLLMSTLAAAYAAMDRFQEAIAIANKSLDLVASHDESLSRRIRLQLESYRVGKLYCPPASRLQIPSALPSP